MKSSLRLLLTCVLFQGSLSAADLDTVHRRGEQKAVAGTISSVSRDEVVVSQKIGNREEHIPANEITRVEWKDEPIGLVLARGREQSGNDTEAFAGYTEAASAATSARAPLRSDIEFLLCRTSAKLAQRDPAQAKAAIERLQKFVTAERNHFRYYQALQLLADAALAAGDFAAAEDAYTRLQQAPWGDVQASGKIGLARIQLAQNQVQQASQLFDEVAGKEAATAWEKLLQLQAQLGQADCLVRNRKADEASQLLNKVIEQAPVGESRLLAEAYVQLGDSFNSTATDPKSAVFAYLHVDVIPTLAAHADLHARSLYHLAKLWPLVGQPTRGAEAAARLEQDYPQSEWAKKLEAGN
ncbi:tetratricopeptide repeat protein [Planctomicrobium sp. SH664]|uniref:tetratricopeptide repeat protein n=1 Tax=Planctomicrobium sp. SH664 TaxID=3448125 RepID=UPI003F5B5C0D